MSGTVKGMADRASSQRQAHPEEMALEFPNTRETMTYLEKGAKNSKSSQIENKLEGIEDKGYAEQEEFCFFCRSKDVFSICYRFS
jgi:hypothetical protein